jgi:hypothetical protein
MSRPVGTTTEQGAGPSMLAAPPYLARLVAGEPGWGVDVIARAFADVPARCSAAVSLLERYVPDPAIRQKQHRLRLGRCMRRTRSCFISHQLAAACIASAWIFGIEAAERRRGLFAFAIAGGLAGAAPLVDYQAVFAAVPIAVHAVVKLWSWPRRELLRAIAIATAAAVRSRSCRRITPSASAACSAPATTPRPRSRSITRRASSGWTKLRWEAFYGSPVKIDNGLFALAPCLLLALPACSGWPVISRTRGTSSTLARAGAARRDRDRPVCPALAGVAHVFIGRLLGEGQLFRAAVRRTRARRADRVRAGTPGVLATNARAAAVGLAVLADSRAFISAINFGAAVGAMRYITAMLPFPAADRGGARGAAALEPRGASARSPARSWSASRFTRRRR